MKQKRTKLILCAFLLPALLFCACTAGDEPDLPDGKYPMTFTAQVDGLTATRATADNTWNGAEEVAIQIGSEIKKYTAANGGSLTIAENGTPFYWTNQTMKVNAWYPYNSGNKPANSELTVKANQSQANNYQASDYLEAVDAIVTFDAPAALTFKHRTAKVVVTLKAAEDVIDLTGATVTFVNQIGVEGDGTEVTPKTETTNGAITYSALLIPQSMQGKQFIKVTVDGKNYYYTPKGMENGNLRAGYVSNYTITVKQNGLSVVWQKGEQIDDTAEKAIFKIHLADFSAPMNTTGYAVTDANGESITASDGVYTLTGNELNISLTADPNYLLQNFSVNVKDGICTSRMKYAADARTYTYTLNVRSDLWLNDVEATSMPSIDYGNVSVGDYFYSDGTYSSGLDNSNGKTCVGIVFKVNAGQDDNANKYNPGFVGGTIHGYILALQDAASVPCRWGIRPFNTGISGNTNNYDGYSNTQKAIALNQSAYEAFIQAAQYSMDTPMLSSGWYLPSYAQWNAIFTECRKNGTFLSNLQTAGGNFTTDNDGYYWTSTESNDYDAHYAKTTDYGFATSPKDNSYDTYHASYVRAILTF